MGFSYDDVRLFEVPVVEYFRTSVFNGSNIINGKDEGRPILGWLVVKERNLPCLNVFLNRSVASHAESLDLDFLIQKVVDEHMVFAFVRRNLLHESSILRHVLPLNFYLLGSNLLSINRIICVYGWMILITEHVKLLSYCFLDLLLSCFLLSSIFDGSLSLQFTLRLFRSTKGLGCFNRDSIHLLLFVFQHQMRIGIGLASLTVMILKRYRLYQSAFWLRYIQNLVKVVLTVCQLMSLVELWHLQDFLQMLYLLYELRVLKVILHWNVLDFFVFLEVLLLEFLVFGDTLNDFSFLAPSCISRK